MNINRYYILTSAFLLIYPHLISSQTYEETVTLLRNKTYFYEKSIRPITNQSSTLVVHIDFGLVSVLDFDEVQESLTVIGGLLLTWTDDFINWNPSDYGGMVEIVSESGKFWTPYLILVNGANKLHRVGESWQRIRFTHQGIATVIQGDTLSVLCKADVKYYPWDDHWCVFEFSSIAYRGDEMSLQPISDKVSTTYYTESGTWELIGSDSQIRYQNASVVYRVHLAREPRFVLVNVVLPIIALTCLNAIIFLIPAESGERISYSITVVLALAVFLTLVGETLPKSSNPMPFFSFYLLSILLISVAITFANIFSLHLYHHGEKSPPKGIFATLTKHVALMKQCKMNNKREESRDVSMEETKTGNGATVNEFDHKTGYESTGSVSATSIDITWKDVSILFDKICLIVSSILLVLAAFVFFMIIFTNERKT